MRYNMFVDKSTKTPERQLAELFAEKKLTLALAESCTGGLVSHMVTSVPGSSSYFKGSVVSYSSDVKTDVLCVARRLIKKHGAVSRHVAAAMAEGAKNVLSADVAASVTGIAGPSGARPDKPVGTAFLSVATPSRSCTEKINLKGSRAELKAKFADALLRFTVRVLKK